MVSLITEALSSWDVMAWGRGSIPANSTNSRFSLPRLDRAASRLFSFLSSSIRGLGRLSKKWNRLSTLFYESFHTLFFFIKNFFHKHVYIWCLQPTMWGFSLCFAYSTMWDDLKHSSETLWKFSSRLLHFWSTFFTLKKADGQAFRSAEVQMSPREFSHGLDFSDDQKYSRLRNSFLVKGLVICFYLGLSGSILQFRKI